MSRIQRLDEGLFVVDGPDRVAGLRIGTRMTVVRLRDGRLFLHAPVPHDDGLDSELEALGPVAFLVAPNKLHHRWLGPWAAACPRATVFGVEGLGAKRPDLLFHRPLEDTPPTDWAGDLDQARIAGVPYVNEVAFLHRASESLLLTDFAMNFPALPEGAGTRLWLRAMGLGGGLRTSRLLRALVRDRAALRAALERVLAWHFDRIVVSHGGVLATGGAEALREAWRPLLGR